MLFLDPIDEFEASLPSGIARVEKLLSLDFISALEFSALRFSRWQQRSEDLLDLFPDLRAWPAFERLRALAGHCDLLAPKNGQRIPFKQGNSRLQVQQFGSSEKDWAPDGIFFHFQGNFRVALRSYGMRTEFASALAGALQEMVSNAVEHANSPALPVACFEVGHSAWAFGVVDVGRGVLASLTENPRYANLKSESDALTLALRPGVSRHQTSGRGNGFSIVFKALVDNRVHLRFRSGGASARWEGKTQTDQKITAHALPISRPGFLIRMGGPMS